ncbi:lysine-specific demethylase 7B-like [Oppia nitens]|uniref:lysine-specific demethylase 7B-like n=1 Tax=Oppia nitens TaxID=1686743 RepID=UPI0023DBA959|nr:lysine-specific demethylase 7B-like [Oppia nitens]
MESTMTPIGGDPITFSSVNVVDSGQADHHHLHQQQQLCVCGHGFIANQFCIQCDNCKEWFHGQCVNVHEYEADELDKYYCNVCQLMDNSLQTVPKQWTNNWRHNRCEPNPATKAVQAGTEVFVTNLRNKKFADAKHNPTVIQRMRGQQLTLKEILVSGFKVPILVESKDGLDLTVPAVGEFTYKSLLDYYPMDFELDVIDVRRQMNIKMKIKEFVDKFNVGPDHRTSVHNCISLEVSSNSTLSAKVRPPAIVNKLSWVENYWPPVEARPQVSKYCLVSMQDSYTDFHIDFGGTSVWYHILSGEKVFYIILPTKENIEKYEQWMASDTANERFLPDIIGNSQCYRLCLSAGQTLFIPTGWIHAVHTPEDSVVFGGNFLHSLNIELQLTIREMEQRIQTPSKFQFPFFELTHWYAAPNVLKLLQDNLSKKRPPKHLIAGVKALVPQLRIWLKSSKDYENQSENEYQVSMLSPKGFNCNRLIKDLNTVLNKAIKIQEGQPLGKKGGKPYKKFVFKSSNNRSLNSTNPTTTANTSLNTSSPQKQPNIKTEEVDDTDQPLVMDGDKRQAATKVRSQSSDSDSAAKSSLKFKLAIVGAKEILSSKDTDTNFMDNILNSEILKSDNRQILSTNKKSNKRKRKTNDNGLDEEVESMIKGRPEDDDYIYLDIETPLDEDAETAGLNVPKDEAWTPRARVQIRAIPKAPRESRDAKRSVVETSLANAAAKLENMPQQKRHYLKKKTKPIPKPAAKPQVVIEPQDIVEATTSSMDSPLLDSGGAAGGQSKTASSGNGNQSVIRKVSKKGEKTAKQRLQKKMKRLC